MVRHTFFKWIGGKEWLWKLIKPHLISDDHEIYIEPFLGGGAIAIHLLKWCRKHNVHKKFILSDTNPGLINAYIQIRDNFDNLTTYLNELDSMESTKSLYYERRKEYNLKSKDSIESAGLFIWLLANGWRGLYRVNKRNEYNSPFGKARKQCYSYENLRLLNKLFKNVIFRCCSYNDIEENGLIYLDPPYENTYQNYSLNAPTNETINKFISDHRDRSRIFISNNEHFKPPDGGELIIQTNVYERAKVKMDTTRQERVWKI
jgi:DNA adenine methylase